MYPPGHVGLTALLFAPCICWLRLRGRRAAATECLGVALTLAVLPDVDKVLPGLVHRGVTHTLLAAVVAGVLVSLLFGVAGRDSAGLGAEHPTVPYLIGAGGVVSHLVGDIITPMGIRPLFPARYTMYSLDLVRASSPAANLLLLLAGTGTLAVVYTVPVGFRPRESESAPSTRYGHLLRDCPGTETGVDSHSCGQRAGNIMLFRVQTEVMQRRHVISAAGGLGAMGLAGCLGVLDSSTDESSDEDEQDGSDEDDASGGEDTVNELLFGFENPDLPAWTVADDRWGRTDAYATEGEASATIAASGGVSLLATATPEPLVDGARIERFSYQWRETSGSFGGGVALANSEGQLELFVGSNNPEWIVLTDTEEPTYREITGAEGYDRWIRTDVAFDWSAGRVTVTFTDPAADVTASDSFDLGRGTDVETIELRGFTSEEVERGNGLQTGSCVMYWDEVLVTV